MKKPRKRRRLRVGRVSYYPHHGGWYLYYQQDGQTVCKRVADSEEQAAQLAAQIKAQLARGAPTLLILGTRRRRHRRKLESVRETADGRIGIVRSRGRG